MGLSDLEKIDSKLYRARPRRRIEIRGQIKIYSQDIAYINYLLKIVGNEIKFLQNQQIRFYAVHPSICPNGHEKGDKKLILLITTDYIVLLKVPDFFKLQKDEKVIFKESLIFFEMLSNIVTYKCQKYIGQVKGGNSERDRALYFLSMTFQKPGQQARKNKVKEGKYGRAKILSAIPEEKSQKTSNSYASKPEDPLLQ